MMFMRRIHTSLFLGASLFFIAMIAAGCSSSTPASPAPTRLAPRMPPSPVPASTPMRQWLLIDLPADATQLQYGAEVYRLVCQDCHGDRGQGLTPEWRATWAPQDQNCWQSRCHAANHPPEGFILPMAPAIVGTSTLARLSSAQDLHDFIQAKMPWYNPGSLTPKDAWAVTAYLLQMNQINPGLNLSEQTAPLIPLR